MAFVPGQRWISNAEPELGLGTVVRIEGRTVQVLFATAGMLRRYAMHAAPLSRAQFRVGQKVSGQKQTFAIERISENEGLFTYHGSERNLPEAELDDTQPLSRADERLLSARVDAPHRFDFRAQALARRAVAMRSPAWGLASARIDLIAHQLRVAAIMAQRRPPRALLADEVGLGKTIEAGMILARLLASGRATRVLVLTPASLAAQWFIELLRRFNLSFALFDEERCEAIEIGDATRNPFDDEQTVIAEMDWLAGNPRRAAQLLAANWDLVVVDEAHHLEWTPESAGPAYALVERLAQATPGLILLTATPQQLGRSGHFARLRLLDPARYTDLDAFIREGDDYARLSQISERLIDAQVLSSEQHAFLVARFANDAELGDLLARYDENRQQHGPQLIDALIDRHGTGRVMFRNRRAQIGGFPRRLARIDVLDDATLDSGQRERLLSEFHADGQTQPSSAEIDYAGDPRLPWLLALLERHAGDKFLLICRTQTKVTALEDALRTRSGARIARFHENMGLVQRDRNAAFFADPQGARVLLCSEIGSEGRNFQFAHRLILWDLPHDPDLLEQRIGRLDRIGQRHDIEIHAAAFAGTAQHALLRWFDEGLDALRSSPADGREILRQFGARMHAVAQDHARGGDRVDAELDVLIADTAAAHAELSNLVQNGRDRLLELASQRQLGDNQLALALHTQDTEPGADAFMLELFEQFGISHEETAQRGVVLDPEYLSTDGLAGFKDGPQQVTFDRATALSREELPLLRLDHPLVHGALDLLLESEHGNAAILIDQALPMRTALLECVFVLDCVAERSLDIGRFLPPLPIRVTVDTRLSVRPEHQADASSLLRAREQAIDAARYRPLLAKLVPPMLAACETEARRMAATEIGTALADLERELGAQRARLVALARINPAVRDGEIEALDAELLGLKEALAGAAPRLDAIRFSCSSDIAAR
ncbi:MAG: RNA polymerase-associated protein RapA [Dokdonella sp.]|uniref:RNA polymerase-associated protein RapA n=1 Tax=Dokdonella sp. TaxID=2291710 RepID=UPI0025C384C2|nr:RNA polymerase-associated protein RapA [Dokdonella sp.]MBZ0223039.1 RNA polymerase-associated protein RapA [Dokdonella sp.]